MNEWISVKDRIPEEKEVVLIYHEKEIKFGFIEMYEGKMEWDNNCGDLIDVEYWQPLPLSPDGENISYRSSYHFYSEKRKEYYGE